MVGNYGRQESVANLEIWYLGADVIKPVEPPTKQEMIEMEGELKQLWDEIKGQSCSIDKFPANPSVVKASAKEGLQLRHQKMRFAVIDVIGHRYVRVALE